MCVANSTCETHVNLLIRLHNIRKSKINGAQ